MALKRICDHVTATDSSHQMLSEAQVAEGVNYLYSPAEELDLPSAMFDIMTVGLAFHWFERGPFLKEAYRVLVTDGWLIIYQNFFYGIMKNNPQFEVWMTNDYLNKYPAPPRNSSPFGAEDAASYGFSFAGEENYKSDIDFTIEELTNYLSTQTNMIDAIESDRISVQNAMDWLKDQVGEFFLTDRETFRFGGWILFLRK